ncbi:MAG: hypothetical protein AAF434_05190 [Pseudomonadota bacterium]
MINKQNFVRLLPYILLGAYSLVLLSVQYRLGETGARPYFSDIPNSPFLFGINTTLSCLLLIGCALLFSVTLKAVTDQPQRWFCLIQIAVFLYMGIDDRFMLHERVGYITGRNDAWILVFVAGIEGLALLFLGKFFQMERRIQLYLLAGATCFFFMIVIDVYGHRAGMPLRLALEDLMKSWSALFFFLYSYAYMDCYVFQRRLKVQAN